MFQFTFGQSQKPLCGYDIAVKNYIDKYPAYAQAREQAFNDAKNAGSSRASQTFVVPVVVHVLWNNAVENIADSVIFSQINILNEDYGRRNADTVNCRAMFDSVGANTGIQFRLDSIIRIQTSNTYEMSFFGLPDSTIKYSAAGGSDAVDPIHHLNIWVINFQASFFGQLLGYAYPPANLANWPVGQEAPKVEYEGVVLDYRAVGGNNPNTMNISGIGVVEIKGRTATHEVGHYLGLRHIWGDGGSFIGPNDCLQSDGIYDTPFANAQSDFDCNKTKNTCSGTDAHYGFDAPDMVENYMDYSTESCMNLFTRGQANLMRGVLLNERADLPAVNVGIAENNNNASQIVAYPNPAIDKLLVNYPYNAAIEKVELLSLLGQKTNATFSVQKGVIIGNLAGVEKGVYLLSIAINKETVVKRIVVE
jgi:hypothetical protein